jgi:hypothetical protein
VDLKEALRLAAKQLMEMPRDEFMALIDSIPKEEAEKWAEVERMCGSKECRDCGLDTFVTDFCPKCGVCISCCECDEGDIYER